MEYTELTVENDIITIEDNTYTQLRNQQNNMIRQSMAKISSKKGQASSTTLAQNTQNAPPINKENLQTETTTTVRSKVKQLVSESADTSEDQKDE